MRRFRTSIIWLAAIFVLTGSAIGFAQGKSEEKKPPKAEATEKAKPEQAGSKKSSEPKAGPSDESGERKQNHGFFVSQAAHCEDVDDPETSESPDFTAPEDCTGSAHGKYVSSVAQSSIGKKPKNK